MSLGLRVTFNALARGAQTGMSSALTRLHDAQQTVTTGKRITRASDDPAGAAQVITLQTALGDIGQYARNGDQAKSLLTLTDGALSSAGDLVRSARTVVIQAANATTTTPEARAALAEQIATIKEQLVGIANTNTGGRYLFAGQKTDTRPFDPSSATPNAYAGDSGALRLEINRGEYVTANVPGGGVFQQLLDDLDSVKTDVLSGNSTQLSNRGITQMSDGLNRILNARGRVGALVNQVEGTRSRLDAAQQEFQVLSSNIADADMPQAIVALQAAQNVYQAALASTAQTFQQSLMDYLR